MSISEIANYVAERVGAKITITPSTDPRSYRINSDKLLSTGFKPKKKVEDAVTEIIAAYKAGHLVDEDRWYNLKWMEKNNLH